MEAMLLIAMASLAHARIHIRKDNNGNLVPVIYEWKPGGNSPYKQFKLTTTNEMPEDEDTEFFKPRCLDLDKHDLIINCEEGCGCPPIRLSLNGATDDETKKQFEAWKVEDPFAFEELRFVCQRCQTSSHAPETGPVYPPEYGGDNASLSEMFDADTQDEVSQTMSDDSWANLHGTLNYDGKMSIPESVISPHNPPRGSGSYTTASTSVSASAAMTDSSGAMPSDPHPRFRIPSPPVRDPTENSSDTTSLSEMSGPHSQDEDPQPMSNGSSSSGEVQAMSMLSRSGSRSRNPGSHTTAPSMSVSSSAAMRDSSGAKSHDPHPCDSFRIPGLGYECGGYGQDIEAIRLLPDTANAWETETMYSQFPSSNSDTYRWRLFRTKPDSANKRRWILRKIVDGRVDIQNATTLKSRPFAATKNVRPVSCHWSFYNKTTKLRPATVSFVVREY